MRFVRLRLNGFKSFVDPTDLVIADGLTGVVGPNGCGKSNLLEALRWVMGENRPTAMRGGGMEDVIFAGAATRPARNFAEVSLTLDNSERLAPAGFNALDSLDIVRRITRDVGSAYKAAGKDVRARDVQLLFADASTGAHSPALVRQGQIAELINARPKARRRILEEAAGISGLYQRRHEAELKLNGTETNLTRVEDVLENLKTQLGTLERQARAATRYRDLSQQVRHAEGVLLYRRWREAAHLADAAQQALKDAALAASEAERAARSAEAERQKAEDVLPPLREEEAIAAAILQRLLVQRDTLADQENRALEMIQTLTARIAQIDKDSDREEALNRDAQDTIARLEWERDQLDKASEGFSDTLAVASDAARAAADVLRDRETAQSELTEDVARLAARHQSAERLLIDNRKTAERAEAEAERAGVAVKEAKARLDDARDDVERAEHAAKISAAAAEQTEADLVIAEAARADAQAAEIVARGARSEAEGEVSALSAEVTGLTRLVARDASKSAAVLDDLKVHDGYEAALGAALSEDVKYPLVDDTDASGWLSLGVMDQAQALPDGAAPLSDFVKAPTALARRLSLTGVVGADQGAALQAQLGPGQRLVSKDGDLWRWDGFRTRAADVPSATALRLQQINRLAALERNLQDLTVRADTARNDHEIAQETLRAAIDADKSARLARRSADTAQSEAGRTLTRVESEVGLVQGKMESLILAVARHADVATEARRAVRDAQTTLDALENLDDARATMEEVRLTVDAARMTMLAKRSAHDELRRDGEARTKRLQDITQQISGWRHRLDMASKRSHELAERRAASQNDLSDASAAPSEIAAKRDALSYEIQSAEARKACAADKLSASEGALRDAAVAAKAADQRASEAREGRAGCEARADAARDAADLSAERIEEALNVTPHVLLDSLGEDPDKLPPADEIEIELARLKRQREAMGAVNLRAEEDATEVRTELEELTRERDDLNAAIAKLRAGIAGLNKEGRERLLTAFEEVNRSFGTLFTHLFGGGEAKLVLVESDDPLEAGLEIMCQPPGKKLSTLSLLSGGEQTLTAMALIFAVFLANPAPICVLDEVDAPLDDANVNRFCDLLDEMTRRTDTRFLIITHHAVTMARMDRLFGVTMGEQGVSQLVSVDLKKAASLVA